MDTGGFVILPVLADVATAEGGSDDYLALFSLVVAAIAAAIAIWIAIYQVRATERSVKLQTYQRLHEALVSETPSRGRRKLFIARRTNTYPTYTDGEDWDDINQALALYDTLGSYLYLKQVPEDVVLQAWYHPLKAIKPAIDDFKDHRSKLDIMQPWAYLQDLLDRVERHNCECPSCRK